jgi:hypothetical protein
MQVYKKGQPGTRNSRLHKVRVRVWPLWVLCTQSFPAFLQEAISRTWTDNLMVTKQQLYRLWHKNEEEVYEAHETKSEYVDPKYYQELVTFK